MNETTVAHGATARAITREAIDNSLDEAMVNLAVRVGNKWTAKIRKCFVDVRRLHTDPNASTLGSNLYDFEMLLQRAIYMKLHSVDAVDMTERVAEHVVNDATYNSAEPIMDQLCQLQDDLARKIESTLREINELVKASRSKLRNLRKAAEAARSPKPAPSPTRVPKALQDEAVMVLMHGKDALQNAKASLVR